MKFTVHAILLITVFFLLPDRSAAQHSSTDSATVFSLIDKAEGFFTESNYDSALACCSTAESLSKKTGFKKGQAYALIEATDIYIDKDDLDKAQSTVEAVNRMGQQMKDSLITAITMMQMAQVKMYSNKFDEAITFFDKALRHYLRDHPTKYSALAYNDLGYTWGKLGQLDKQADCLINSINIYEKYFPEKHAELAIALSNLSTLYYTLDKRDKAIEYGKRSLSYREKAGDVSKLSLGCCNLSQYYIGVDNAEAEKYLKLCEKYAQQSKEQARIIHADVTTAHLYNTVKNQPLALEYETKAIALLEKRKSDSAMLARRYLAAGTICREMKTDTAVTMSWFNKALGILRLSNDKINLRDFYSQLTSYYAENKNYADAYASYKRYILYKDSIISANTNSSIAEITTRYETKKKDDEIMKLNTDKRLRQLEIEKQKALISGNIAEAKQKQNEITVLSQQRELQDAKIKQQSEELEKQLLVAKSNAQELKLSQQEKLLQDTEIRAQKQVRNIMIGGAIAVVLLAGFMFNRYQLKKKLDRQKELLDVRNNIARDLHDEIGSTLTSIKILSEVSKNNMEKNREKATDMISMITEQSSQMQQGMSDIVWAIKPDNDKLENMLVRMREYTAFALEPKNIVASFKVDEQLLAKSLGMQQRKDVFLIFKEAVNNAAKYSEAALVEVKLYKDSGRILLQISDNGKGFTAAGETSSNGLKNIKARAEASGGKAEIVSVLHKGTSVTVTIPAT